MKKYLVYAVLVLMLIVFKASVISAQTSDPVKVKTMIARYKKDARGPYLDIRWFCQDGSIRAARDPCPDKPGNQRARYKDEVTRLAKKDHIFLGQILTTTPFADFWDAKNANSRLIQYQLEQFLRNNDNGWINRRAQYYRGAVQYEDENNWGIGFYNWRLADSLTLGSRYFLLRQSALAIPHTEDTKNAQGVRALSREISDSLLIFQDLRIKIHNMPDEGDIALVKTFQKKNKSKIPARLKPKFEKLLSEMALMYRPFQVKDFDKYISKLPGNSDAAKITEAFVATYGGLPNAAERCQAISHTALALRKEMLKPMKGQARLALIDIVNKLEMLLNVQVSQWETKTLGALTAQLYCLSEAAAGFGFLELWEWEQLKEKLAMPEGASVSLQQLRIFMEGCSNVIHWGTAMVWAHYTPVINMYKEFEPLAGGFYDDLVRSSVLLPLGQQGNRLSNFFSQEAGLTSAVFDLPGQSAVRGLNPGYAMGELVVVNQAKDIVSFSQNKIYAFHEAPSNLKPVAGIISVTEGNMVSHVQLLARNLGIPNAVISHDNLEAMRKFSGKEVFFAVSNKGTVVLKPAAEMDASERNLFKQIKVRDEKIAVPVERIRLDQSKVLNLREVSAIESGVICGPKAANLGQLKRLFPDQVVEGLVLPFGIFRRHMDQMMPGKTQTYWQKMTDIFDRAEKMRTRGVGETEVEMITLKGLDTLRALIGTMPFMPQFRQELEQQFLTVFNKPLGELPVFIRSDTNMEDLKDFSGAGLNLTVFNVLDAEKIWTGIRNVWASPYAERSYKWRQCYLYNPENVYPSILIIPSVNADKSGVIITKGIISGNEADITAAFNRGVGGAVDGQAAESWLLSENGYNRLTMPARELSYLSIPATGGSLRLQTSLENPILEEEDMAAIRQLTARILKELPETPGINTTGPFDMELGFKDHKMWLFQVRPFVENKQATASAYLEKISPVYNGQRLVQLDQKI